MTSRLISRVTNLEQGRVPSPRHSGISADVAVIGAGIIGATIAWRCAQRGLQVALLDAAPGSGASRVAAGMLAPVAEAAYGEQQMLQLCQESAKRYPAFLAEIQEGPTPVTRTSAGTVVVALGDDDQRELARLHAVYTELGLQVATLSATDCRRLEPLLTPHLRGGLALADEHAVDPRELHAAVLVAAERAGVQLARRRVSGLCTRAGAVTGVLLDDEIAPAGSVVLATGAWSGVPGHLAGLPRHLLPPVRPVKGDVLRLRGEPGPEALRHLVRGWVHGSQVYAVPYGDGRVVVGATSDERGFDPAVSTEGVYELLRDALAIVPALGQLELVEVSTGFRPGTPDNAPLIGATALPGLLLATGHYRNGILLAPVTADAIAALLADEPPPASTNDFSPLRFTDVEHPEAHR
jgi:glycine oxidase